MAGRARSCGTGKKGPPRPLRRGSAPTGRGSLGDSGAGRPHCQTHHSSGGRDLGAQSSCPQGGVAEPRPPRTCARSDSSAPPSSASTPSPGRSSASLPGTDPLPSAPSFRGGCPPFFPPSGLTPSRSHWKSRTLVPGGVPSWTLTASTVLSSPVEHPCTLPSGKVSSSSWKGENGVLRPTPPPTNGQERVKGVRMGLWGSGMWGVRFNGGGGGAQEGDGRVWGAESGGGAGLWVPDWGVAQTGGCQGYRSCQGWGAVGL